MRRFLIDDLHTLINGESSFYPFPKEVEHRLSSVLRMKDGDNFEFIDGNGLILNVNYKTQGKKTGFEIISKEIKNRNPESQISLVAAIIRRERFELLIEKAVELGTDNIYPVYTEYSKPYGHDTPEKLKDRWQKIADQAISQCKRNFRCIIHEPQPLADISKLKKEFNKIIALHPGYDILNSNSFQSSPQKVLLLIGPEGGFSDSDLETIKTLNPQIFSLNTSILRTETAAIYMLSVINYVCGGQINEQATTNPCITGNDSSRRSCG